MHAHYNAVAGEGVNECGALSRPRVTVSSATASPAEVRISVFL